MEIYNTKTIIKNLVPKETRDVPRVTLQLQIANIKDEEAIEKEVDILMEKIKALVEKGWIEI